MFTSSALLAESPLLLSVWWALGGHQHFPGQTHGQMDRGLPWRGKVKGFLSCKEPCVKGREIVMAKRLGCVVYLWSSKSKFWYPMPCAPYTVKFCICLPNTPSLPLLRVLPRSLWGAVLPPLSMFVVWGLHAHFWPWRGARSPGLAEESAGQSGPLLGFLSQSLENRFSVSAGVAELVGLI